MITTICFYAAFRFSTQWEDYRCKHGQNAQDDRRLEKAEKGGKTEAKRGENKAGQTASRGERALWVCAGPPQHQVQRDGCWNREGGEEEEETSETQEERGRAGLTHSDRWIQPITLTAQNKDFYTVLLYYIVKLVSLYMSLLLSHIV